MNFSVRTDIRYALGSQKRRKAADPDGLPMEAFMFAGHRLYVIARYSIWHVYPI